jgi:hypothetical protein
MAGGAIGCAEAILKEARGADRGEAFEVERQRLLVIGGRLDRAGGALDAEADEIRGGYVLAAHGAGPPLDIGIVAGQRRLAGPVAVEGQRDLGAQHGAEAIVVAGAFLQHIRRRIRIDPDQAQYPAPGNQLAAEAAEVAGGEVRIASPWHRVGHSWGIYRGISAKKRERGTRPCYDRDVIELILIIAGIAVFPVGLGFLWLSIGPAPRPAIGRQPIDTGPAEPCWSEEIGGDGRYRLARRHCPHALLMEMDARAARGDFPIPKEIE